MDSHHRRTTRRDMLKGAMLGLTAGPLAGCASSAKIAAPAKEPAKPLTPVIASKWHRVVEYPDHHLNDFCLFLDRAGTWHAVGIMGTGTWESEQSFFHCSGKDLLGKFDIHKPIFTDAPGQGLPPQKHAPFVVYHQGKYHLFYRRPPGTILMAAADSPDHWTGLGTELFAENDARDVHVLRVGDMFHMYYCQAAKIENDTRSCILLRRSDDLRYWSVPVVVHYDTASPTHHSYLESPCVIQRPEGFYLFIRHRFRDERTTTKVLFSPRPDEFPSGKRAWFCELNDVHAPEVVQDKGRYYLARVSGAPHANRQAPPRGGWLDVAELAFK